MPVSNCPSEHTDFTDYFECLKADLGRDVDPELANVISEFQRYYYLPDPGALIAVFGAVAGNFVMNKLGSGEPIWLMEVGGPSTGKSIPLEPLLGFKNIHPVEALTAASLLSLSKPSKNGKSGKQTGTGGLLREMEAAADGSRFGILVNKELSSIWAMKDYDRDALFSLLRGVYDGHIYRHAGTEGGQKEEWHGQVGFVGACTGTIEQHREAFSKMGDRFVFYNMPVVEPNRMFDAAVENRKNGKPEKNEKLRRVVQSFLQDMVLDRGSEHYEAKSHEALSDGQQLTKLKELVNLGDRPRNTDVNLVCPRRQI